MSTSTDQFTETDTTNRQMVAIQGDFILVIMPQLKMTKAEALLHAAWLVALADDSGDQFQKVLEAVESI